MGFVPSQQLVSRKLVPSVQGVCISHRPYNTRLQPTRSATTPTVALFLLAYVLAIIAFVWCKGRPARERLPSRWKPMESKES